MIVTHVIVWLLQIFAKRTDQDVRQVERWFRLRRNQDRPSLMQKFTETG